MVCTEDEEATSVARAAMFGSRLSLSERYAQLLAGSALERGLIGPREVERLWERHLLNCGVMRELIPDGARVVDIGSGAGLPGIVLAIARPDIYVTLVESRLRPVQFLTECVEALQLSSVNVQRARAEEMRHSVTADVVTARAVASLPKLIEWSLPMLRPGGELLAMKGDRAPDELAGARSMMRQWGVDDADVTRVGGAALGQPTTVVRLVAGGVRRGERTRRRRT